VSSFLIKGNKKIENQERKDIAVRVDQTKGQGGRIGRRTSEVFELGGVRTTRSLLLNTTEETTDFCILHQKNSQARKLSTRHVTTFRILTASGQSADVSDVSFLFLGERIIQLSSSIRSYLNPCVFIRLPSFCPLVYPQIKFYYSIIDDPLNFPP
jgi:hypothetical protein